MRLAILILSLGATLGLCTGCIMHSRLLFRGSWNQDVRILGLQKVKSELSIDPRPFDPKSMQRNYSTKNLARAITENYEQLRSAGSVIQLRELIFDIVEKNPPNRPILFIHGYDANINRFNVWMDKILAERHKVDRKASKSSVYELWAYGYPTGYNWESAPSNQNLADELNTLIEKKILVEEAQDLAIAILDKHRQLKPASEHGAKFLETARYISNIAMEQQKVDLICHSNGGILAKHYLRRYPCQHHIDHLVTINTPHYGANWAWGKSWIIRAKDVANIIRSLNPLPLAVRTHVPELERQILELTYASSSAVQMDRDLKSLFCISNGNASQTPQGQCIKPVIIAVGSENDTTARCASALWSSCIADRQELWLDLEHSMFTDDKYSSQTAIRIADALSMKSVKRLSGNSSGKPIMVVDYKNGGLATSFCWADLVNSETTFSQRMRKIPGALIVMTHTAPQESSFWSVKYASRETYVDLNTAGMPLTLAAGEKITQGSARFVPQFQLYKLPVISRLAPYYYDRFLPNHGAYIPFFSIHQMTNWVNPLHVHRDVAVENLCCDYFCLDFYHGDPREWHYRYDVKIKGHGLPLIGQDFIIFSNYDLSLTRNVLFDLLLPDAIFHLPDSRLLGHGPNSDGNVVVLPARTTVIDVDELKKKIEYITPYINPSRDPKDPSYLMEEMDPCKPTWNFPKPPQKREGLTASFPPWLLRPSAVRPVNAQPNLAKGSL